MAPTSRPRVGWAAISRLRVGLDLARQHELLLVAARERAAPASGGRRRARRRAGSSSAHALDHGLAVEPAEARDRRARRSRAARVFSASEKSSTRPWRWRSSGMCPTPASDGLARATRAVTSTPCRSIAPPCGTRMPASAWISSLWPLPSTPAMPTISPARTSSERPRTASSPRSSRTQQVAHGEHRLARLRRRRARRRAARRARPSARRGCARSRPRGRSSRPSCRAAAPRSGRRPRAPRAACA